MLTPEAIYRFNRSNKLRYYRAGRTESGIDFLVPISIDGSKIVDQATDGREYVILYILTKWGKLGAGGYWLNPKKMFEKVYVTDATVDDLDLVADDVQELYQVNDRLDNVLNRHEIQLDMEVWGKMLA